MRVSRLLEADRFAAGLGARLVESDGDVVVEMDVAPHHRDATGRISAGALFSLADCAMSLISNSERTAVAIATHFVPGRQVAVAGTITAVARPDVVVGEGMTSWQISLTAGDALIASFRGTTLELT